MACVAALAACGSDPRLRVDGAVLEKITIENKLLLFDAENELDIALDDKDQVLDELEALDRRRAKVEEERARARRDIDLFRDKGNPERAEIAALQARAAEAQLEHLEAERKAALVRLEREERALVVARARFELAKARLVKRNNVPGAADLKLEDFEEQVERYQERVLDLDDELDEAQAEVDATEEAWSMAAARLRDESKGAYGSRWLD